ncbi:hypothetical protein [Halobacillus litoralis]|uniref:hypothetical protein n=1 Tax=Halobacillus litoralis TaxID=45668 RepID=UPI001CFC4DC4|nr:hypothetical protein [Halobacillus litoralis]
MHRTKVITIASVSGGGKTTITKELQKRLSHSAALFFDDYNFNGAPEDLMNWVEEGPDYNQWDLKPLIEEVEALLACGSSTDYILLDYPFSYKNDALKNFIDLSIYIDTPLDIALARRLIRDYAEGTYHEIHNDVDFYLESGRGAYLEMENTIKPNADVIVDGSLKVDEIADVILPVIRS